MILYDEGNNNKQISEKVEKLSIYTISETVQKLKSQGLVGESEIDRSNDEKVVNLYNEEKITKK